MTVADPKVAVALTGEWLASAPRMAADIALAAKDRVREVLAWR